MFYFYKSSDKFVGSRDNFRNIWLQSQSNIILFIHFHFIYGIFELMFHQFFIKALSMSLVFYSECFWSKFLCERQTLHTIFLVNIIHSKLKNAVMIKRIIWNWRWNEKSFRAPNKMVFSYEKKCGKPWNRNVYIILYGRNYYKDFVSWWSFKKIVLYRAS